MNCYKFLFLLPLLSGCFHDGLLDCAATEDTPSAAGEAYVTLSLSMAQGKNGDNTRSAYQISSTRDDHPTGGENGDGQEDGQSYENEITTLRVFFFERNDNGVNGPTETPVKATADFGYLGTTYTTGTRKVALPPGTYDVVAVANVTDEEWAAASITTLGELRDHIQKRAWSQSGNSYGQFVMASADEADETVDPKQAIVTITTDNDITNPAKARINIERHAARVDYKVEGIYECEEYKDSEGKATATVEIIGAGLVNNLTTGTYMLKRVAKDIDMSAATLSDVTYLGEETVDVNRFATNYVIDPWTREKWIGNEKIDTIFGVHYTESEKAGYWDKYIKDGTPITKTDEKGNVDNGWKRAAYTMENTTAASETSQMHNTGMVFKAKFHPAGLVTSSYANSTKYKDGSTFFRWGTQLYADIESIIEAFWAEQAPKFTLEGVDTYINKCANVDALKDFAETLPENDPVGYRDSLLSLAKEAPDDWRDQAGWKSFMKNVYGYERNTETGDDGETYVSVTVREGGTKDGEVEETWPHTRKLLESNITVYKDAICYYIWWIRHSNDNNEKENGKMEYAIVRNNIYELEVESIDGLGSPIPVDGKIKINVYVRDWKLLDSETMEM